MAARAVSPASDSSRAEWLRQARSYLHDADPVLARLIDDRLDFRPQGMAGQAAADGPL